MPKPLDETRLKDLALAYVARFATTGAKLEAYLARKLRERGSVESAPVPDVRRIVERMIELRYVDDEVYAKAKAGSLLRKGYGGRRVEQALREAGVDEDLREEMRPAESSARQAAYALASRRRFGPFATELPERDKREKQIAAMIRAGHGFDTARQIIEAETVEAVEQWIEEAEDEYE